MAIVVSLAAGYASARFIKHLSKEFFDSTSEAKLIAHIDRSVPHFDARVFHVPTNEELLVRTHISFHLETYQI